MTPIKAMKTRSLIYGAAAVGCALGIALPPHARAAVSDEDFNQLKEMVHQLDQKVQNLEQVHHQDQQTHQQDQQQIQQLKKQVGQTQKTAVSAEQKAEAAAQVQPVHPVPAGVMSALHNVTLAGDAEIQYGKYGSQHGGFGFADFAPIFLYRANDNILFETGFDTALANDGSTSFDLSFAQLDYLMNDYMTVVAGDMVLPLGTYSERAAGWLNKIPDDPLPYQEGILPGSGVGVQLRGSLPLGERGQMVTYSVYGVNGPVATYDNTGAFAGVALDGGNVQFPSLNSAPSAGGRLGWFVPLKPHYDLELGVSGESGERADYVPALPPNPAVPSSLRWSGLVLDGALHVSPYVEVKGEYMYTWEDSTDLGNIAPRGWWVQGAYKLAGLNLDLPLINNVETVVRYDTVNDGQGTDMDRYTAGLVYYFTNTLLFEGDYEFMHNVPDVGTDQGFVLQLSYGF
jgi:hypothetical protein